MPRIQLTPKTKAPCWNCGQNNRTHILPDVRLMHCPAEGCGVILPGESEEEYALRKGEFGLTPRTRHKINTGRR